MSDERPNETIDPGIEKAEPKFDNCWTDCERELIKVDVNGIEFRLRSITVGEEQRIADELKMRFTLTRNPETEEWASPVVGDELTVVVSDSKSKAILTVCAALGAWTKYGNEGWGDPRQVTQANVEALKGDVLEKLYIEYGKYFRTF